jgi:hypothetical protein
MVWKSATHVDPFGYMFRSLYWDGAIFNMDLSDGVWSFCSIIKLVRIGNLNQNFLIDCVVKRMSFEVLMTYIFIDQNSPFILDGLKITD